MTEIDETAMPPKKIKTLRQLKFKVMSSAKPYEFIEIALLEEISKSDYMSVHEMSSASFNLYSRQSSAMYNDNDVYVDMDSKKLWRIVERVNESDFAEFVLKMSLEDGVVIEDYEDTIAKKMYSLKWLKDYLVEWYCK